MATLRITFDAKNALFIRSFANAAISPRDPSGCSKSSMLRKECPEIVNSAAIAQTGPAGTLSNRRRG